MAGVIAIWFPTLFWMMIAFIIGDKHPLIAGTIMGVWAARVLSWRTWWVYWVARGCPDG